ncbi:hypothetical protein M3G10_13795, partial [Dietzia cinnamea]|nr:hypothetical protein [Dietzia cinnamea]
MTAAPAPPRELTIAVLGARDSAAPAVASALSAAAGPAADAGARIRVLVDAAPEDRPDAAVLVVDAVCPVRPDDVEVARGVAARLPMAVAVAGRARTCTAEHLSETVDVTTRRLVDAGVRCPVQVVDEGHPGAPAALLSSLLAAVRADAVPTAPGGPVPRAPGAPPPPPPGRRPRAPRIQSSAF